MQELDKSGKWIIQQQTRAVLRLAGLRDLERWKAVHAEPVLARVLPDGLIEAYQRGSERPILVLLEISKYAYTRLAAQLAKGAILVSALRGEVPEVIALVLRPRGRKSAPLELELKSAEGTAGVRVRWRVVELWKVPAEELLATGDIGLVPFLPLSAFDGPVDAIVEECRKRIERDAPPEMREDLLVVTHALAGLQYNDARLFQKLGGTKAMFKTGSPLLRELFKEVTEEGRREGRREAAETDIMTVLEARFGPEARTLSADVKAVSDARLRSLVAVAATCLDLDAFRRQIAPRKRKGRNESQ